MDDEEDPQQSREPDCDPALRYHDIGRSKRVWVRKCGNRFLERDSVLRQIRSSFPIIPFEITEDDRCHALTILLQL
jgi:hypothetical protein